LFRLSTDHAAFVESGVSITVASRDSQNRPLVGRSVGCVVADDRQQIKIFLSRRKYPLLVDAIRRSGAVAVSFSEPSSHTTLQLKSTSAELTEVVTSDTERVAAHVVLFAADLERIFHRGALARAILECSPGDLVAVAFYPLAAFSQTPGPLAGCRIDT
jgi:hypothetical protein